MGTFNIYSHKETVVLSLIFVGLILLSQMQISTGTNDHFVASEIEQRLYTKQRIINLDGDLKAPISIDERNKIWKGEYPEQNADWFSGEIGESQIRMWYNFNDLNRPFAECEILFIQAYGNRPFPFMSSLNDAFPKIYINHIKNVDIHFDINFQEFSCDPDGWLRTSVVVALGTDESSDRIYLEQDIKDSLIAKRSLPLVGGDVVEVFFEDAEFDRWVHLDVPFGELMAQCASLSFAQPFLIESNETFIESCYIVNECFGNGHIRYSVANFWISVVT